jgi:gluconolactonase
MVNPDHSWSEDCAIAFSKYPLWMRKTCFLSLFTPLLFILAAHGQAPPAKHQFSLQAQSPKFWNLFAHDAKLDTLATGFGFTEGALWDERGFVWVSDETLNKLFRVYSDGRKEEFLSIGDPDGNTYDKQHRLLDCASVLRAVIRFQDNRKDYDVIADRYQGMRFNSPNDVVLGPDGAIYFTDPTYDLPQGEKQEIPFQGVYRVGDRGEVQLLTKDLKQPNGLAFSPDGKHLYIDDSDNRNIHVFDFNPNRTISNGRIFGEEPGAKDDGVPDGMKVDRAGNVYVTGPQGIWVWDAEGHHLGTIVLPEQPANLAWGDADYSTLYITATTSVYKLRTMTHGFVPYLSH